MALILCAECSREISDKAASCPSCGAPRAEVVVDPTPKILVSPSLEKHLKQRTAIKFQSDTDVMKIRTALGEKLNSLDSKFNASTMRKVVSGVVMMTVDVSKVGPECLISVDHNLKSKSNASAAILIGLITIPLAWIFINGWLATAIFGMFIWGKYIEDHSISLDKLDRCLSSFKAEFGG